MTRFLVLILTAFLALTGLASAQTADLLITEYVEGSGYYKALEIFNGLVDDAGFDLEKRVKKEARALGPEGVYLIAFGLVERSGLRTRGVYESYFRAGLARFG